MNLRFLTAQDIRQALSMPEAIEGMKLAFVQFSLGQATVPLRSRIEVEKHQGITLFMPALLQESDDLAIKIVSVFPNNAQQNLPTIHAAVLVIDPMNGAPLALMEGAALTAIRTGAASGAATDLLARKSAKHVAIFGSGVQARTQLEAVCNVREIEEVSIFSPDREGAEIFCAEMQGTPALPNWIKVVDTPEAAIESADIICTATTSSTPVFPSELLDPGTHINAVGSYTPTMQEIDISTMDNPLIVVDSREAVLAESGDLIIPIQQGCLDPEAIHGELGEIVDGTKSGRSSAEQISVFKSVGLAVQDAMAASIALKNAAAQNLGIVVDL